MLKSSMKWVITMLAAAVVVALAMAGSHWQIGKANDSLPTLPTVPNATIPFTSGDYAVVVDQSNPSITIEFPAITLNNFMVEWEFTPDQSAGISVNGGACQCGFVQPTVETVGGNMRATFILPAEALQQTGTIKLTAVNNYDASDQSKWSSFGEWTVDVVPMISYYIPKIGTRTIH